VAMIEDSIDDSSIIYLSMLLGTIFSLLMTLLISSSRNSNEFWEEFKRVETLVNESNDYESSLEAQSEIKKLRSSVSGPQQVSAVQRLEAVIYVKLEYTKLESSKKNIRIEKHDVCEKCHSIGITDNDCVCTYSNNYKVITLEFEVCKCCGNLMNDGDCADTEFNAKQLNYDF
jgi:hypothetical protein